MPENITTLDQLMKLNNELEAAKAAHTLAVKEVGQAQRRAEKKATAVAEAQKAYDAARKQIEDAIAAQGQKAPAKK